MSRDWRCRRRRLNAVYRNIAVRTTPLIPGWTTRLYGPFFTTTLLRTTSRSKVASSRKRAHQKQMIKSDTIAHKFRLTPLRALHLHSHWTPWRQCSVGWRRSFQRRRKSILSPTRQLSAQVNVIRVPVHAVISLTASWCSAVSHADEVDRVIWREQSAPWRPLLHDTGGLGTSNRLLSGH